MVGVGVDNIFFNNETKRRNTRKHAFGGLVLSSAVLKSHDPRLSPWEEQTLQQYSGCVVSLRDERAIPRPSLTSIYVRAVVVRHSSSPYFEQALRFYSRTHSKNPWKGNVVLSTL